MKIKAFLMIYKRSSDGKSSKKKIYKLTHNLPNVMDVSTSDYPLRHLVIVKH